MANVALHALLLTWLRRHRGATLRRRHLVGVAVLCAVPLAVAGAFGVASWRVESALRQQAAAILATSPWSSAGTRIDDPGCGFCGPTSLEGTATQLGSALPPERVLLDGIDARLRRSGFTTNDPWSCVDVTDAPPQRRVCFHGYDGGADNAFLWIYYFDHEDPQLRLDLNRRTGGATAP